MAAGAYRRIDQPRRGRPVGPAAAQLPGAVPGLAAPEAAVYAWQVEGSPVHRRLRNSPRGTEEALKGSIVQECSPRPYHNEEKVAFAFDAAPATGGVRGRSLRRAAPAPNPSPSWSVAEDLGPEWAHFPTKRRSLSPRSLMAKLLAGEAPCPVRRLRRSPSPQRLGGRLPTLRPAPALVAPEAPTPPMPKRQRQSVQEAQLVMERARPLIWFGESLDAWSPFSWSTRPVSRAGDFSPRRHRSQSPLDGDPRERGLHGRSHLKGLYSPRDRRSTVLEPGTETGLRRGKLHAPAPSSGMSAALEWRG